MPREGSPEAALQRLLLDRAVSLDPRFPLYRARRAWLEIGAPDRAAEAFAAAEEAVGVPALWLGAGQAAEAAGETWVAAYAYEVACSADPLGALAPFGLARVGSPLHDPVSVTARALATEPRLAAALWWRGREALREEASVRLATSEGIEVGWRAALRERVAAIPSAAAAGDGSRLELALVIDGTPESSLSLHAFRRRPLWGKLAPVLIDAGAAAAIGDLPPAIALESTDPRLFPPTCTGVFLAPRDVGLTPYRPR